MQSAICRRAGITAAALLLASAVGHAQQPAPAKAGRIGVLDLERVAAESLLGKDNAVRLEKLQAGIRAEGTKRQQAIEKMDGDLKAQREQLIKDQPVVSPDVAEERQRGIERLMRQREAYRQDSEEYLAQMQRKAQREAEEMQTDLRRKIAPAVEGLVKDLGLDVVLDVRVCVASSSSVDVTGEVIRRADATYRAAAGKAEADKPAAPTPPSVPAPAKKK
jgi:Skp family chaperone for outer membrane proteins